MGGSISKSPVGFNTEMLYDLEGMGVTLFYDTSIVAESVGIGHWCQEDYFAKAAILLCIPQNKWFVIYNPSSDLDVFPIQTSIYRL